MQAQADSEQARELVKEIDFLVAGNFFDARQSGFSPPAWHTRVERTLEQPVPDTSAAYRYISSCRRCRPLVLSAVPISALVS